MSLASDTYANYEGSRLQSFKDNYMHIKSTLSSIWYGGARVSYRFQHLESPGSKPIWALFSRPGLIHFLSYFETWIADSFAYFCCCFVLFIFDEIHVKSEQNFSERSKIASTFCRIAGPPLPAKTKSMH